MNDPSRPSLLERLSAFILREPGDREQLVQLLRSAYSRNLLDADAMSIIEGALTVSEIQVRDIMVPRAQVDFIDINEPVESFIPQVISTAHSRFPVIDQNRDDVIGILLAKDLLRYYAGEEASDNILPEAGGRYRVKALTQIADLSAALGTKFPDEAADTVGGLVIAHLGRLPKRGESVLIEGTRFQVLRADSRRVYTLLVDKPKT